MSAVESQITSVSIVCSTVGSGADDRNHQSSTSMAFVWGFIGHQWIPHTKGQYRGKCFHLMTSSWRTCVSSFMMRIRWSTLWSFDHLTHWGRDKMAAISQTIFSSEFSWMKIYEFRLRFHWSLFPRFKINNIPALVQIMDWRRSGDKPLSDTMMG